MRPLPLLRRLRRPERAAAMRPAAFSILLFIARLSAVAGTDLTFIRSNGQEYVSVEAGASRLGLHVERSIPQGTIMLKEGAQPLARLVDHSRETDIRGLRVFFGYPVIERKGEFYISRNDYDVRLVPRLRPDLSGPLPRQPHVIALDPGHGGVDHGTENRTLGTMEKTYTLDVAVRLKRLLEAAGYKVVLTRDTDVDVPKQIRSEIANEASADLFVSIHFNSLYPNTKTTGVEVLSFPPKLERSTNSWSPGEKDDSQNIEAPINDFNAWNTVLAASLHRRLVDTLHSGDRGEKFEHLGVLRMLKCPGVLVESAFLSSDTEASRLKAPSYRDTIAAALLSGIQDYAEILRRLRPAAVQPSGAPATPATSTPAARAQPTRPART